jgi:hypothetical protein
VKKEIELNFGCGIFLAISTEKKRKSTREKVEREKIFAVDE